MYPKSYILIVGVATTSIVLSLLCQSAKTHAAELDEGLLKRFQIEAPKSWKKQVEFHKKFFSDTSGVTIDSKQKVSNDGKSELDEYQEKRIRTNYRQMISKDMKKGHRTLQCANPRYAFELANSSSGEWVITGIHPYQVPPPDESDVKDPYNRIMEPPREIRPQALPIEGTLNQVDWLSEDVKIQDIKLVSVNKREFVEVSIVFPFKSYEQNGDAKALVLTVNRHSAVGVFDPSNDWVLTSFVWIGTPPWKMTRTFGYDENIGRVPFLSLNLLDYLKLLDWTGRQRGCVQKAEIPADLDPILKRIGIDGRMWVDLVWGFKKYFGRGGAAGSPKSLKESATNRDRKFIRGQNAAAGCFVIG